MKILAEPFSPRQIQFGLIMESKDQKETNQPQKRKMGTTVIALLILMAVVILFVVLYSTKVFAV